MTNDVALAVVFAVDTAIVVAIVVVVIAAAAAAAVLVVAADAAPAVSVDVITHGHGSAVSLGGKILPF